MCDTAVVVGEGEVWFAKNSDRDANEAQVMEWHPAREYPAGATVRCTWISVPQARRTHAVLLARPFWMWGAEMGANEHGVVIGNEAVFTRERVPEVGLTGMDLLRLALERADTAERAVSVIVEMMERYGQGGRCGHEAAGFRYFSSFIVADRGGAFVLETSGRRWATERVRGARTISNGLTISSFAERESDVVKTWASACRRRRAITQGRAEGARSVADMMALLRDHGDEEWPQYRWINGAMAAPCMHAGGLLAASQTVNSWVARLRPEGDEHWVTATAAPCISLFKPVRVSEPVDLGPAPTDRAHHDSLWWRHERFHRRVMRDPARLAPGFIAERDAVEARWLAASPSPHEAFTEADALLGRWSAAAPDSRDAGDERPVYISRYWNERNRRAGL